MTIENITETEKTTIRVMTADDLWSVADVHMLAFPESIITKMGKGASERYYKWQLEGPHSLYPIVALRSGEIVGFCFGGVSRGSMRGYLKKYGFYLFIQILFNPTLFLRRKFFRKMATALRSLFGGSWARSQGEVQSSQKRNSFGILAICVIPSVKGSGVAREIMEESESEARKRGFSRMHLTVASDNGRAIRFYEKLGYVIKESDNPTGGTYMEKELK